MKKLYILLGILGFLLCRDTFLNAVTITVNEKEEIKKGVHCKINCKIEKENNIKKLFFDENFCLKENLIIKTTLPVVFNAEIQCLKLDIEYTTKYTTKENRQANNRGLINCRGLQLSHETYYVTLINENKGKIFLSRKDVKNSSEIKYVNLSDYKLINFGTFCSNAGLKFKRGTEELGVSLVYQENEARIINNGIIRSREDIHLSVPTYIGENGTIKTRRNSKIFFDNVTSRDPYPVYAIIRVLESSLNNFIDQSISSGQLGEESAKHYYLKFKDIKENEIGTFKDNSEKGIDIVCNTETVIIHESKNIISLPFKLSPSTVGVQCSKIWLQHYLSKIDKRIEELSLSIDSVEKNKNHDARMEKIYQKQKKDLKFYKEIVGKINDLEGEDLSKNNLILNGSSIHHVKSPLADDLPFYYCQRNIDAVFNCEKKKATAKEKKAIKNGGA